MRDPFEPRGQTKLRLRIGRSEIQRADRLLSLVLEGQSAADVRLLFHPLPLGLAVNHDHAVKVRIAVGHFLQRQIGRDDVRVDSADPKLRARSSTSCPTLSQGFVGRRDVQQQDARFAVGSISSIGGGLALGRSGCS